MELVEFSSDDCLLHVVNMYTAKNMKDLWQEFPFWLK